jgi:hypothetical protein
MSICKFCRMCGFDWIETDKGWRLASRTERTIKDTPRIHVCQVEQKYAALNSWRHYEQGR